MENDSKLVLKPNGAGSRIKSGMTKEILFQ